MLYNIGALYKLRIKFYGKCKWQLQFNLSLQLQRVLEIENLAHHMSLLTARVASF